MATASQIKSLIKSHFSDTSDSFSTIALQIAAHEAQTGHKSLAIEIRKLVDESKLTKPRLSVINPDLRGLFLEKNPVEELSDLIVADETKKRIVRVINEYENRDKLYRNNLENRRKILFAGPSGTGKTMTASVIAKELGLPLYVVLTEKLVTKFMGETSARLRQIFDFIEIQPAVYLFDEFDAIGGQRGKENEVAEMRRVLNSFLQFIERDHSQSLILAATNNLELLDQALFRRFDDVIRYELPTDEQKLALLVSRVGTDISKAKLQSLVSELTGLSHAEISQACLDAIKDSVLSDKCLDERVLLSAIKERKSAYSTNN